MKRQKKKKRQKKPKLAPVKCINCGEKGPHFVPPSLGDKGFFICKKEGKNHAKSMGKRN